MTPQPRARHAHRVTGRAWSEAWHDALYGPDGFFLQSVPADHFRTNVAVPLFGTAIRTLADRVDAALGFPDPFDVVDVGAGRGELLLALGDVPSRWQLTGVDLATAEVPFTWSAQIPSATGLLIANEWLDAIPLDVLEDGRLVLVTSDGTETLGPPMSSEWASLWWPSAGRVEVGASRDLAWASAVARMQRGLAVAVDYGHTRADRRATLTGYRAGRQVPPVPDGTCDLTAHVAVDACAAATGAVVVRQREALQSLGISAALPDPSLPSYGERLVVASQARELLDPDGLGGFSWLVQEVGLEVGWMSA